MGRVTHPAVAALAVVTFVLAAACGAPHDAAAREATIYGRVLNGGPHGTVVTAARMRPDQKLQMFHARTSTAGAFSLTVPPGEYVVASPPCFPTRDVVRMRAGSRTRRNFNCGG